MGTSNLERLFTKLDSAVAATQTSPDGKHAAWLHDMREQAGQSYKQLTVPHPKQKSWSKLSALELTQDLSLPDKPEITTGSLPESEKLVDARIIVSEKAITFQLSSEAASKGVVICSLEKASQAHKAILKNSLTFQQIGGNDKVSAFTAGSSKHGFFLYIPAKADLEKPLEILIQAEEGALLFPVEGWLIVDEGAQAAVILRQAGTKNTKQASMLSLNLAIDVRDAAALRLLEIQQANKTDWSFFNETSRLGKDARLDEFVLDAGGAVNKRILTATLAEDGGQATITGIYTPHDGQVFVYDTHQNHNASHTTSDLLFNGVLDGNAYSLWTGNVYVAKDTKGADGFQINRNLMLDEAAHAESIPGLEIIADDVRCSHAVTVSSVDEEQLFFLESRGIGPAEAEELIVSGFLEAASNRMKDENLAEIIRKALK